MDKKSDGCWIYQGADNGNGYCSTSWYGKRAYCHRIAYELVVGPIPEGLVIDHLCRVRKCVNPEHLEAVTQQVNVQRAPVGRQIFNGALQRARTHCPAGHPLSGENLYEPRPGRRGCRACRRTAQRRYKARLAA